MPSSHTQLTMYNLILDMVGERAIASVSDTSAEVRWLNRNWQHARELALRGDLWNFSMELHSLNADAAYEPNQRWQHRYPWPNNALRFLAPTLNGVRGGHPVPYELIGNYIYSNHAAPMTIIFVMNESDPGEWDALFCEFVAASMAERMAKRFVRKSSFIQDARASKLEAHEIAMTVGAIESGIEEPAVHDIISARSL